MTELRHSGLRAVDRKCAAFDGPDARGATHTPLVAGDPLTLGSSQPLGRSKRSKAGGTDLAFRKPATSRLVSFLSLFRFGTPKGNG